VQLHGAWRRAGVGGRCGQRLLECVAAREVGDDRGALQAQRGQVGRGFARGAGRRGQRVVLAGDQALAFTSLETVVFD